MDSVRVKLSSSVAIVHHVKMDIITYAMITRMDVLVSFKYSFSKMFLLPFSTVDMILILNVGDNLIFSSCRQYLACDCDVGGSISIYICDKQTGVCTCRAHIHGRSCKEWVKVFIEKSAKLVWLIEVNWLYTLFIEDSPKFVWLIQKIFSCVDCSYWKILKRW